ncbi:translesion DNA synthesis-associated protein ImuA [Pseudoalteromonas fenneropenaei]|uniref:Translesion DNA synthesis-associated protein ImuA n=1 Tax=Pseudoalteromonas fenneropenaei TaxID=1737459 RepID=A0ABV7CN92_9GAMM
MNKLIDLLTHRQLVWQGKRGLVAGNVRSSGFAELDAQLQGGFPQCGVMDLRTPVGIGELRLLLPSLSSETRLVVLINPPAQVNALYWQAAGVAVERLWVIAERSAQEALWTAEWCAKSGVCCSVLLWHQALAIHQVKRLQLAAQEGQTQVWLVRAPQLQNSGLPLSLSLALEPDAEGLKVQILKRKGGWAGAPFRIAFHESWPDLILPVALPEAQVLPLAGMPRQA